ncbi:MAG: dTDP-4-amino-4,6-dideoxygalactose transaminase [Bacteroidetes Order II. Incertae sedis bacterium]|nr:dTDP-4-amino-4,6-dideoxygalactose transaminase [Bacteroidetes Order II. bacterium]
MKKIPFNKPYLTGKETLYIQDAVHYGKISGNGKYTQMCHQFFEAHYGFGKCLLTTSCTDALEMAALLLDIQPGDEVILPSYTFVSTANAFVLRGAKLVFADSRSDHPGIEESHLKALITARTKAIVVVHYAGVACDMEKVMALAHEFGLYVVEDAAQAIDSFYTFSNGKKVALGSIGHLAAFSFHETKNIISGEGGMLVVNDSQFVERAEIIWEKGTNRAAFYRGEVDKYGWIDVGSSFLPSEIVAAFLFAQLEYLTSIQEKRKKLWFHYFESLKLAEAQGIRLPFIPHYATNNAHMFYVVAQNGLQRQKIIDALGAAGFHAVFHYLSLHRSPFYAQKHDGRNLPNTDLYTDCLIRLPLFYELDAINIDRMVSIIKVVSQTKLGTY